MLREFLVSSLKARMNLEVGSLLEYNKRDSGVFPAQIRLELSFGTSTVSICRMSGNKGSPMDVGEES